MDENNNSNTKQEDLKTNIIASISGISISLIVVVIVFVFNKDTHIDIKSLLNFNYDYILLAFGLFLLSVFINGFRIKIMSKTMNSEISLLHATNSVFMGLYVSNITPSMIGGQPYQIYLMSRYDMDVGIASAIVATQFVTVNIFNLLIDIYFFPYLLHFGGMKYMWIPFFAGFSLFLFMIVSVLFISFNRKFLIKFLNYIFNMKIVIWFYKILKKDPDEEKEEAFNQISNFHDGTIKVCSKNKLSLIADFLLASLSRILILAIPYVFYLSFFNIIGSPLSIYDFIVVQIVTMHVAYFVPTPGSSGGFEGIFLYLFSSSMSPKTLSMIILGWRFVTYYFVIIIGTIINIFMSIKMTKKLKGGV